MLLNHKILDALKIAFLLGVCLLVGCEEKNSDKDFAALGKFLSHNNEAVNTGDVEAEVNRFTEDGTYMWPGVPAIEGRDALREWFEQRFAEVDVNLESESLELQVFEDWAFERGTYNARIRKKKSGELQVLNGKYLNILQKQPYGSWLIYCRIRNLDHPLLSN